MYDIKLTDEEDGAFVIEENSKRIAEMEFNIDGKELTVYHTEVSESFKGKGIGTQLLNKMVDFAREKGLIVNPLCPFVHNQFKQNAEKYSDIWEEDE